ncbi:hypothetical protein B0H19DRAFT_1214221 [Mycena capillaripes]|nr:hypothetical protein B0H19DRAFT_1214221 [Mycena capillaripes]
MARRANEVVRLLEELRRLNSGSGSSATPLARTTEVVPMEVDAVAGTGTAGDRIPKRPWEEMDNDEEVDELEESEQPQPYPTPTDIKPSPPGPASLPASGSTSSGSGSGSASGATGTGAAGSTAGQTTAEQDMELIRTKRASTTGVTVGGVPGQPKSKYRKRSRATPPGKCHSCNIRETPEWRRGPDGARTLCNACGLHYAKLMRKREKEHGANGSAPQIDMDTLRASARADMAEKSSARANKQAAAQAAAAASASASASTQGQAQQDAPPPPPPPPAHHEGSFQLTLSSASLSPSEVQAQMAHAPPPPPPQPWAAQRAYAPEQLQHQSFLRTPQIVGGQASPR